MVYRKCSISRSFSAVRQSIFDLNRFSKDFLSGGDPLSGDDRSSHHLSISHLRFCRRSMGNRSALGSLHQTNRGRSIRRGQFSSVVTLSALRAHSTSRRSADSPISAGETASEASPPGKSASGTVEEGNWGRHRWWWWWWWCRSVVGDEVVVRRWFTDVHGKCSVCD